MFILYIYICKYKDRYVHIYIYILYNVMLYINMSLSLSLSLSLYIYIFFMCIVCCLMLITDCTVWYHGSPNDEDGSDRDDSTNSVNSGVEQDYEASFS